MKNCLKYKQYKQYYKRFEEAVTVSVWFSNLLYKLSDSAAMLTIFVSKLEWAALQTCVFVDPSNFASP